MRDIPILLIIADDLTGAADSAARWLDSGLPAEVRLTATDDPPIAGATALVSDSRHLTAPAAAQQIIATLAIVDAPAPARWYKKIDSTLRGNLGAEIDAALTALGRSHALICPAFPDQQRGLKDGKLVCPPNIAAAVDLPSRLAEQSARPYALIPLNTVRALPAVLETELANAAHRASLIICDAMTNQDLALIANAATRTLPEALLCGSAGLIGALAAQLNSTPNPPPHANLRTCKTAVVVVGSGSTLAHRQIQELQRQWRTSLRSFSIELDGWDVPAAHDWREQHFQPPITLIHQPPPAPSTPLDGPTARSLAALLAEQAADCIGHTQPELLILVGGDTSITLLRRLAIERLILLQELMPGIPLARAIAADQREFLIVLKAGSFGDPQTLVTILALCMRDEPCANQKEPE